jgi:transcriptional regulator with XRE-family HTH domain
MISRNSTEQLKATTMDNASRNLGQIFKQVRHKRSLSQNSLSEAANINNSYYCSIERGTVNVTVKKFLCICWGLEIPPEEVMRRLDCFHEEKEEYGD